jgi:type IV pilus assembly protein PilA
MKMKKNNKGFTLVELIVVLVILAILAAILIPHLMGYVERANSEKNFSTAQSVRVAAQASIDQAFGEKHVTNDAGIVANTTVIKVSQMNGTLTQNTAIYGPKVFDLSGVDTSKVTAFKFKYTNGKITEGYVLIEQIYYYYHNDEWSSNGTTNPFS